MALQVPQLSLREYLDAEEASEVRHEYLNGEVFEMEAASIHHQTIAGNLIRRRGDCLDGQDCRVLPAPRTATATNGLYTYPDVVIVCGRIETWPTDRNTAANPRVIIEVLSKTTEGYDRGRKFDSYLGLSSFVEYVCVAQDSAWILHQQRQDDGSWVTRFVIGLDAVLSLTSLPAEISLADIYRDVELSADNAGFNA